MAAPSSIDISELTKNPDRKIGGLAVTGVQDREPYINMLVYGDPGSGKTVLTGSAHAVPEMSPVLFIDVEGGTFSLRKRYPDVDVVRVTSWIEMQNVYNELYRGQHGYKTVVLDSLSEIQKLSMLGIMREVLAKEPDRDPEVPSIREWGKNGEQIRRMIRAFRDLKMNVLFTALAVSDKDQKTGKTLFRPGMSGKLAMEVSGYVDLCAYLYIKMVDKEMSRFMLTGTTETHVAKDRSDLLPMVVQNPSMQAIYDYIFKQGD